MTRRSEQLDSFLKKTEFAGARLEPLAGDASARRYIRANISGKQAMVMDTPVEGENFLAFVQIAEHLYNKNYSAPKILARDIREGFLLLEDFGDESFSKILNINIDDEKPLYSAAIDLLAQWHNSPIHNDMTLNFYDEDLYLREISLFPDWFLPQIMGDERISKLRSEYMEIWRKILRSFSLAKNIFVHRDFHADNLMWLSERAGVERIGLLDFQDAVIGDPAYDMVSLLEDARRDVPQQMVDLMIEKYIKQTGQDRDLFLSAYNILGAQRNSKIIGIFARLAIRDGKQNYLKMLPRVWKHLERDIQHPLLKELRDWLSYNVADEFRGEIKLCRK
ncbi:MAG: phosphotransferase [Rickettsiales bacterium]